MDEKEKAVREVGVQANICLADIEDEEDGVTLLGRQGLTLRIGGEEGLYQEVAEGVKGERAKEGDEYCQLGPPLPPRAEHKRKDLSTYLGMPPGGHLQGRKDIIKFLGMAQNDKRSDKSKEISRLWELAQKMVWLSNSKDSEQRRMGRRLSRLHCFLTRTQSEGSEGKENVRMEEKTEKMNFPHKSAASNEARMGEVLSTFRDGWEEERDLSSRSFTSSCSSSPSSSTASSTPSLSSASARPTASSSEEPIYMEMLRAQPTSANLAKTAFPRGALISEISSNDYIDMSKMSKLLNLIHE